MAPERVPIVSPSRGEYPIVVATDRPPSIAQIEAPLPRCSASSRRGSGPPEITGSRPTSAA
jgi:hypothetical protein